MVGGAQYAFAHRRCEKRIVGKMVGRDGLEPPTFSV